MSFPVVSHSPLVQSPTLIFACLSGSAGSKPRSSRLFLYFSRFSRLMANRRSFFVIIPILPPTLWDKGFLILTKYQHLFVIPYFSEKLFLCQDKKTAYFSYFCRYYPEFLLFFAAFSHDKQVFGNFYDKITTKDRPTIPTHSVSPSGSVCKIFCSTGRYKAHNCRSSPPTEA